MEDVVRSEVIIDWIETYCNVPEGKLVGQPVKLLEFQREFIRDVYDNPVGTRRAILSVGRKNGKTALCAFLLLVHLVGPLARRNSQLYSAAQSRDQAALLFKLAAMVVRMSPDLVDLVMIRDTAKSLYCPGDGTVYRALSADATTAYGLSPVFTLFDELGQVRGESSELYQALETASAAHEDPLTIIISTQAPTESDLLSILIKSANSTENPDPSVVCHLYAADMKADPFDNKTIREANPAIGVFQVEKEVMRQAATARRIPSEESRFRNLILNQCIEAQDAFLPKTIWDLNSGENEGWEISYGGLDLSEVNDLTAFVLVSPVDGVTNIRCTFWLPDEGLKERSERDRVPWVRFRDEGWLKTNPGKSIEYKYVAKYIADLLLKEDIRKIAFDRWNMRHFRPWLLDAGLSDAFIDDRFVDFGQGFVSMSPAMRTLESIFLNEKARHDSHPVLTHCASNAIVKSDEAGNRKLDKKRSTGRIDGMVALVMACAVAEEQGQSAPVFPVDPSAFMEDLSGQKQSQNAA